MVAGIAQQQTFSTTHCLISFFRIFNRAGDLVTVAGRIRKSPSLSGIKSHSISTSQIAGNGSAKVSDHHCTLKTALDLLAIALSKLFRTL